MKTEHPLYALHEVKEYIDRVGAKFTSVFRASVSEMIGRYERENNWIVFSRNGEINTSSDKVSPTEFERTSIAKALSRVSLPNQTRLAALATSTLPQQIRDADPENVFEFRDLEGNIVMIQVRVDLEDGNKRYVPFTYWDDAVWRIAEPEGKLPLWGVHRAKHHSRVFIHEGAKAARAAQRISQSEDHPFSEFFSTGCHVGWINGAHAAWRADWDALKSAGPKEIILFPDNDFDGLSAMPEIAKIFRVPVRCVEMDSAWPTSWDCADPIPEKFKRDGQYFGPEIRSMLIPFDWATDSEIVDKKRVIRIREGFAKSWVRINDLSRFAHIDFPQSMYSSEQFNYQMSRLSDSKSTANILSTVNHPSVEAPTFNPSLGDKRIINANGRRLLNQYVDSRIKPKPGINTDIWWEFFEYLFPIEEDRHQMRRWLSTLYAKPEVRMAFGVLVLSTAQGVGKSTVGDVAARLIGPNQCSFPGDTMITASDFNGWLVNKRLIVVHEIYAGASWRAYNRLKTLITDSEIEANVKNQPTYTMPNWAHFYCASNSMEALRIEKDDRRWLVPQVATEMWSIKKYQDLWSWIRCGGLAGLAHDLSDWNDWVLQGEAAPLTSSKEDLIENSLGHDEQMVSSMLEQLKPDEVTSSTDLWFWVRESFKGKSYLSKRDIPNLSRKLGYSVTDTRVRRPDNNAIKHRFICGSMDLCAVIDRVGGIASVDQLDMDIKVNIVSPEVLYERIRGTGEF